MNSSALNDRCQKAQSPPAPTVPKTQNWFTTNIGNNTGLASVFSTCCGGPLATYAVLDDTVWLDSCYMYCNYTKTSVLDAQSITACVEKSSLAVLHVVECGGPDESSDAAYSLSQAKLAGKIAWGILGIVITNAIFGDMMT
jgi:hypothetical protein